MRFINLRECLTGQIEPVIAKICQIHLTTFLMSVLHRESRRTLNSESRIEPRNVLNTKFEWQQTDIRRCLFVCQKVFSYSTFKLKCKSTHSQYCSSK